MLMCVRADVRATASAGCWLTRDGAQCVLAEPKNWMVYTMALLLRSRLDAERSRTVERGVLQMQVGGSRCV